MSNAPEPVNTLSARQLRRVRELFDEVLDCDPQHLEDFLHQECGDDPAVRMELEKMLEAHGQADAWLDRPLQIKSDEDPGSMAGRFVGPYLVVRPSGSGGMGSVYVAERRIGRVRQQVALKIIRSGLAANSDILRRFENEREILASLDHPNIAHLLDIGTTEDGVPYLVMDYVDGKPIDQYCEENKLSLTARLQLFRMVCAAVEYAHSKGVVHRDLKPANIFVRADGTVKLLDFGISKVLDAEAGTHTQTGAALMTIEYASPEQIHGETAGPASDVYSLGVVLYELLTGRKPYRITDRMIHSIARVICEDEPVAPSVAEHRLAGNLEAILLKALRKNPDWRYASAAELSEDIRRHLSGERVLARRESLRYRVERILHRVLYPSSGVFHAHGVLLWTAGVLGVILQLERQAVLWNWIPEPVKVLDIAAVTVWLLWSLREGGQLRRAGRFSHFDLQAWIVFTTITVALGLLTIVSARLRVVPVDAMAIFWNIGLAIGLLIIGLQASRLMTAGGAMLLASGLLASLWPGEMYLCLGLGMLAGMVAPGIVMTLQRCEGE